MKLLGVAIRAVPRPIVVDDVDVSFRNTCMDELPAIRFGEIDSPGVRWTEQLGDFRADLVTAPSDTRPDGGQYMFRRGVHLP